MQTAVFQKEKSSRSQMLLSCCGHSLGSRFGKYLWRNESSPSKEMELLGLIPAFYRWLATSCYQNKHPMILLHKCSMTIVWLSKPLRFCARLGFGDDIESAEEKRSRRLGKRRVTDLQGVRVSTHKNPAWIGGWGHDGDL